MHKLEKNRAIITQGGREGINFLINRNKNKTETKRSPTQPSLGELADLEQFEIEHTNDRRVNTKLNMNVTCAQTKSVKCKTSQTSYEGVRLSISFMLDGC